MFNYKSQIDIINHHLHCYLKFDKMTNTQDPVLRTNKNKPWDSVPHRHPLLFCSQGARFCCKLTTFSFTSNTNTAMGRLKLGTLVTLTFCVLLQQVGAPKFKPCRKEKVSSFEDCIAKGE